MRASGWVRVWLQLLIIKGEAYVKGELYRKYDLGSYESFFVSFLNMYVFFMGDSYL